MNRVFKISLTVILLLVLLTSAVFIHRKSTKAQESVIEITGFLGFDPAGSFKTSEILPVEGAELIRIDDRYQTLIYDFGEKTVKFSKNTIVTGKVIIKAKKIIFAENSVLNANGQPGSSGSDAYKKGNVIYSGNGGSGGNGGNGGGHGMAGSIRECVCIPGFCPKYEKGHKGSSGKGLVENGNGKGGENIFDSPAHGADFVRPFGGGGNGASQVVVWPGGMGGGGGGGGGGYYIELIAQESITFKGKAKISADGGAGGNGGLNFDCDGKSDKRTWGGAGGGGGTVILRVLGSKGIYLPLIPAQAPEISAIGGNAGQGLKNVVYGDPNYVGSGGLIKIVASSITGYYATNVDSGREGFEDEKVKSGLVVVQKGYIKREKEAAFANQPFNLKVYYSFDSKDQPTKIEIQSDDPLDVLQPPSNWKEEGNKIVNSSPGLTSNGDIIVPVKFHVSDIVTQKKLTMTVTTQFGVETFTETVTVINRSVIADLYSGGFDNLDSASSLKGVVAAPTLLSKPAFQMEGDILSFYNLPENFKFDDSEWGNTEITKRINRLLNEFEAKGSPSYISSYPTKAIRKDFLISEKAGTTTVVNDKITILSNIVSNGKPSAIVAKGDIEISSDSEINKIEGIFYTTGKFSWKPNGYNNSFKGVIIAKGGVEFGVGVTKIEWDPDILANPPPGFGGLFIPVWE